MDEDSDSGSGAAVAMADIFYDNTGEVSSPEPASPASDVVDVKPLIRPSIIVPNKSKLDRVKIFCSGIKRLFITRRYCKD